MKISFFSTQPYDKEFFNRYNDSFGFQFDFFETQLNPQTVNLINDTDAVCVFVNDVVNEVVIQELAAKEVKVIALRCAGFNNVDLGAQKKYAKKFSLVQAYSPQAVAEHAVALIFTLSRKTH